MRVPGMSRVAGAGMLGWIVVAACSDPSSQGLRIAVENQTGELMLLVVHTPESGNLNREIGIGLAANINVFPAGGDGTVVTFTASPKDGTGPSGSGTCTASEEIVPGGSGDAEDIYASAVLVPTSATTLEVACLGAGGAKSGWR